MPSESEEDDDSEDDSESDNDEAPVKPTPITRYKHLAETKLEFY